MADAATRKPIRVSDGGTAGPYIMLLVDQLPDIRRVLDANGVRYWVDEREISVNGKPPFTVINFGYRGDAVLIQRLLDAMP